MATRSRLRMIASRFCVWCGAFFACFTGVWTVHAAPELALTWPELEGCPASSWIEERVRERLGRPLDDRAERSLSASAVILPQDGRLTLALHVKQDDREGVREISAASCAELAEAAVLVIALAIDPSALARQESEPADNPTETDATPLPNTPTPPPRAPAPQVPSAEPRPAPRFRAYAGMLLDQGSLPTTSVGPLAAIGYQWRRYRAELAGFWLAPRASSGGDGRVTVSAWALAPTGCVDLLGQRAILAGCAALEIGRAVGRGQRLEANLRAGALHIAASAGLRLTVPLLANASLLAEVAGMAPFQRARFVSLDTNEQTPVALHESARLALRGRLAAELRF